MKEIHTEIEINAPAEKVWKVLTDFAAYPEWNPFVRCGAGARSGLVLAFTSTSSLLGARGCHSAPQSWLPIPTGNSAGWVISGCVGCLTAIIRSRSSR